MSESKDDERIKPEKNTYGSLSSTRTEVGSPPLGLDPVDYISGSEGETQNLQQIESAVDTSFSTLMNPLSIAAMLSIAFTYGCIMSTLFLLVLPVECQRIEHESEQYYSFTIRKSIALGAFAAIAGFAQLATPLIGLLSDAYDPPNVMKKWGKRLPYLIFGAILMIFGLMGQLYASMPVHVVAIVKQPQYYHPASSTPPAAVEPQTQILAGSWALYTLFYTVQMIGINISYTIMIAFIPDYVPHAQTGAANGTLALMAVLGSLFGFAMFHLFLGPNIINMYKLYFVVALTSVVITCRVVYDRECSILALAHDHTGDGKDDEIDENKKDKNKSDGEIIERMPSISELAYILLYEPIMNKTQEEILSAFWIDISQHKDFFVVTLSRFFYYMGISSQTFFLYFIHDALKQTQSTNNPESAVALLAVIGQSAGAITCYPIGIISDQYFRSRRKPFVYAACLCLALGNLGLIFCTELSQMMWVVTIIGAANGVYLTMDTSLAVDTLEISTNAQSTECNTSDKIGDEEASSRHQEQENNANIRNKDAAQLLGVWGVFGFIGSATGPLVGGIVLLFFGRRGADPGQFYSLNGYEDLFALTAFYFLCSAVSLGFVQKKGV
jgi:hypothetical protein